MPELNLHKIFAVFFTLFAAFTFSYAQPPEDNPTPPSQSNQSKRRETAQVRPMTIPISILTKQELREKLPEEFIEAGNLSVKEDGEQQTILSIRSVSDTPLALAILIQEDLSTNFNLEIQGLKDFIRRLPKGSRVMVAYIRSGSLQVRQKFTDDLDKASASLRIVAGGTSFSGGNPYEGVLDALKRFDALPNGRRALLMISDGLDLSRGADSSSPSLSVELDRAVLTSQRKGVAVYSIYSTTALTENNRSLLSLNAQGSLSRLSDETGGRAFFQGTGAPVSFAPFLKDLTLTLNRQFALTYLSTHPKKGYHKVQVTSTNPEVKIEHPRGYYHR